MKQDELQQLYAGEEYYWGTEPNEFARLVADRAGGLTGVGELRVVDLGCGEGRDAVFFADRGMRVLAVDAVPNALEKVRRFARARSVAVETVLADVNDLRLAGGFELVYSTGAVQYLRPENRERQFARLREATGPGGMHALLTFVDHPEVPAAPDWGENEFFYEPGELPGYYPGWEVLHARGFTFEDNSGGVPHRHAAEEYILRAGDR